MCFLYSFDTHSSEHHMFFFLTYSFGSWKSQGHMFLYSFCRRNYICAMPANNNVIPGSQLWHTRITFVLCLPATCNFWLTALAPKKYMFVMPASKHVTSGSQLGIQWLQKTICFIYSFDTYSSKHHMFFFLHIAVATGSLKAICSYIAFAIEITWVPCLPTTM